MNRIRKSRHCECKLLALILSILLILSKIETHCANRCRYSPDTKKRLHHFCIHVIAIELVQLPNQKLYPW